MNICPILCPAQIQPYNFITMNCKESNYELISGIIAYPDDAVSLTVPLYLSQSYITSSDITIDEASGISVKFKPNSAKTTENSNMEIAGAYYEVKVSWDISKVGEDTYRMLDSLTDEFKHLIIKYFGGNRAFISSTEDGYRFVYEEGESGITCELVIHNINGLQRIIE